MEIVTLSALVVGNPPQLRRPRPLPGETLYAMVIRNHLREWRIFSDRMRGRGFPGDQIRALENRDLDQICDSALQAEVERFVNLRSPTHFRTLTELVGLREMFGKPDTAELLELLDMRWRLDQILWPREQHPTNNRQAEQVANELNVEMVPFPTGSQHSLDLSSLLPAIRGSCVWLVPGGTTLFVPGVLMMLTGVMRCFRDNPRLGLYFDGSMSMVLRTAALRELREGVPALMADLVRALEARSYQCSAAEQREARLCELEEIFGGDGATAQESMLRDLRLAAREEQPGCRRWFGWPGRR